MHTKSEINAILEIAHFDSDPVTTLYSVAGVAALLGIGRNQMKQISIQRQRIATTGKDWISKRDVMAWLIQMAADDGGEQERLLLQLKDEHQEKMRNRKAEPKRISAPGGNAQLSKDEQRRVDKVMQLYREEMVKAGMTVSGMQKTATKQ